MQGILLIDKPAGWTSHDVVARARRVLRTRRIGHTGTLDPFATGLLALCVSRATRLAQFLSREEKEYQAVMHLGFATETGDPTGAPVTAQLDATHISSEMIEAVFAGFRGKQQQVPPMHSAKKIGGTKLYELARRGEVIERKAVPIEIKELELDRNVNLESPGDIAFRVVCTSGTYIRVLAEDIGNQLGVGAHLISLRRTRIGKCRVADAVTLDRLAELAEGGALTDVVHPASRVLGLRVVMLSTGERGKVIMGQAIDSDEEAIDGEQAMLLAGNDELVAIAEFDRSSSQWQPRVVIASE